LYVKRGAVPTTTSYDYRPYKLGNDETVTVSDPTAGSWFIMVRGYAVFSGVTLVAASYSAQGTVTPLHNGVPVSNLSGAGGSQQLFQLDVPVDAQTLEIRISGGTGDADLYVKRGAVPTTTSYDYRPFLVGNNETVTVADPTAGSWFIMVRGAGAFSAVTLVATYTGPVTLLQNGVPVSSLSGAVASEQLFQLEVPSGAGGSQQLFQLDVPVAAQTLEIQISGGTGDADLYVKRGAVPSVTSYDYRPFLPGNSETVTVANPAAGSWFIMIRGYQVFSGVTLAATYAPEITPLRNGVPVRYLGGAAGSERMFQLEVPVGAQTLEIQISGGTGDADLYVKRGAVPTITSYDYRPYVGSNDEAVAVADPTAGPWFIMVRGYDAFTSVTLVATYAAGQTAVAEDGLLRLAYTFTRSGSVSLALPVNFSVGGTATYSTDYTAPFGATGGTVTIAMNQTTARVVVDPTADTSVEADETVVLTVTPGTGYTVGAAPVATGTIQNDDTAVTVAVSPAAVPEDGAANLAYAFTRSGATSSALTVNFSVGGGATFNTDYAQSGAASFTTASGTVVIPAGSSTASVTINPAEDSEVELDETVVLTVTSGTGYTVGSPAVATGTIWNDDGNLALHKPAVASTTYPGLPASNVTDGNLGSRWSSQFSDNEWIYVDLGAAYTINRVVLRWEAAYGRGYQIQVSNSSSSWPTVNYQTTTGDGGVDDITLPAAASGRYVRMLGTQRATAYGYSLYELEVYGDDVPPSPDLSWNSLSASPASVAAGGALTVTRSYQVSGLAVSPNFAIQYRLSPNLTWGDADDVLLTPDENITAAAGKTVGSQSATFGVTVSASAAGTYYVLAKVDNGNAVSESNETNNVIVGNQIQVGGGNLALGKPAVASTTYPGLPASNVTDGNLGSRWSSQFLESQWIYVDLGAVYTINRVVLRWEAAYARGYRIQVSNSSSSWPTVNYETTTGDGGVDDITLSVPASGRYVRMLCTQRATAYGCSLYELEVYAAPANLALGKIPVASTSYPGLPASNATDGNLGTRWSSEFSDSQWIYVDLGAVYAIHQVVLRWEAAYGRGYEIQVSDDASTWTSVYSTTTGDGGVDDITLSAPASGRYVRLLGTQRATAYGYSLWEFEVYG
jgi:hypothetical protein